MSALVTLLQSPAFLFAAKVAVVCLISLYGIFSFVVLRQVGLMNRTFQTDFGGLFKIVAGLHFMAVLIIFFLALILL
uniref:Uncharacterized protein n=1 Tax=candidate division WWE3 bacterium TaxID=2053526 RepID=A0A7C4TKY5_UNCKA